ncbi:MAG: HEAT repeat domain-containing protein [Candidatus Schekmanbacteria bacterium]|nr:HEAT repeat domain-containing protein [Candidatus Schekmanbacteria bacterium]
MSRGCMATGVAAWLLVFPLSAAAGDLTWDQAVKQLKDANEDRRAEAVEYIGDSKEPNALELIAPLAKDPSPKVRQQVVEEAGWLRTEPGLEIVVSALGDPEPDVRVEALEAVEYYYVDELGEKVGQAFMGFLTKEREDPVVVDDPAKIPDTVLAKVRQAIDDKEDSVQKEAARVLGSLRDARSIAPLSALYKNKKTEDSVREAAVETFGKIGGEECVAILLEALDDKEEDIRAKAATALGWTRSSQAVNKLLAILKTSKDDEPGPSALFALAHMPTPETTPVFVEYLKSSEDELRRYAAEGLGRAANAEHRQMLKTAADGEQDEEARNAMFFALAKLGDSAVIERLAYALPKIATRMQVLGYFKELGTEAAPHLFPLLQTKDWEVREYAAKALGNMKNPAAVAPLRELFKDPHAEVADEARKAVAKLEKR